MRVLPFALLLVCSSLAACGSSTQPTDAAVATDTEEAAGDAPTLDASRDGEDARGDAGLAEAVMPLEVLGPAGSEASLVVTIPPGGSRTLAITLHNVVDLASAFVEVAGERVDLAAAGAHEPFGGVGIARWALPAALSGATTLRFVYAREVRDVSGFRVLEVAIEHEAGTRVVLTGALEDPSRWPRETDATSIERGRRYFVEETRDGGPTCGTCHADDGADLAYFAFTSRSIVSRAEHHLFTADESRDIARYLRSLEVPAVGRVYDPPFQPGPGNAAARGAGHGAIVSSLDASLASIVPSGGELAWDAAAGLDTFHVPAFAAVPSWFRWLPRRFDRSWLTRDGGRLGDAERLLRERGSLEDAVAFQAAAMTVGRSVLVRDGDHEGRVEILRFAAVKLWDWQRRHGGFDGPDHGFPDHGPAFPYEVGFAFFEAAQGDALPGAWEQTASWWIAQLAVNEGRGLSTGERPLNYRDVLLALENAGADASTLAIVHLLGSFEEDRSLPARFGTADGVVRLLAVPLRHVDATLAARLLRRFLLRARAHEEAGGAFDASFLTLLGDAWSSSCASLDADTRTSLRNVVPSLSSALSSCS